MKRRQGLEAAIESMAKWDSVAYSCMMVLRDTTNSIKFRNSYISGGFSMRGCAARGLCVSQKSTVARGRNAAQQLR